MSEDSIINSYIRAEMFSDEIATCHYLIKAGFNYWGEVDKASDEFILAIEGITPQALRWIRTRTKEIQEEIQNEIQSETREDWPCVSTPDLIKGLREWARESCAKQPYLYDNHLGTLAANRLELLNARTEAK